MRGPSARKLGLSLDRCAGTRAGRGHHVDQIGNMWVRDDDRVDVGGGGGGLLQHWADLRAVLTATVEEGDARVPAIPSPRRTELCRNRVEALLSELCARDLGAGGSLEAPLLLFPPCR